MPTPQETAATNAAAAVWVDRAADAAADLAERGAAAVTAGWAAFEDWYTSAAIATTAASAADLSLAAQQQALGMWSRYIAEAVTVVSLARSVQVPSVRLAPVREGASLVRVHGRAADVYREAFALTGSDATARDRALQRADQIVRTDLQLAGRQVQNDSMRELGVRQYRRVLRPELSQTGPCGLCVVAADRKYRVSDLLPMHGGCCCITLPIYGEFDPGVALNREDLQRVYAAAGDTTNGRELKNVRVRVDQHGELGPVLTYRQHRFTGPDDLVGGIERGQAANQARLAKLQTVLDQLQDAGASLRDREQRLQFQRAEIARTQTALAA